MRPVSDKRCPECGSDKVHDTGTRIDEAGLLKKDVPAAEPKHPMFVCDECEVRFVTG